MKQSERCLTEEQLVLVNHIRDTEVNCSEYQDERLDDAVEQGNDKDQNCLGVHSAVVDHRRCIELSEVYVSNNQYP